MKRYAVNEDYDLRIEQPEPGRWSVSMPHQCSEWEIIGWDWDKYPEGAEAVAQMELFVEAAQDALGELRRQVEAS